MKQHRRRRIHVAVNCCFAVGSNQMAADETYLIEQQQLFNKMKSPESNPGLG
jgi:hypothetical protein